MPILNPVCECWYQQTPNSSPCTYSHSETPSPRAPQLPNTKEKDKGSASMCVGNLHQGADRAHCDLHQLSQRLRCVQDQQTNTGVCSQPTCLTFPHNSLLDTMVPALLIEQIETIFNRKCHEVLWSSSFAYLTNREPCIGDFEDFFLISAASSLAATSIARLWPCRARTAALSALCTTSRMER